MKAFNNDIAVKEKYLSRVRAHRAADEIMKGQYWAGGRGCAVGCTIHSSDHQSYEAELGLPEWLAYLEDAIFEGLPLEQAVLWPERFLEAIPVGADVEPVLAKFLIWLMDGVRIYADERGVPAIGAIIGLWRRVAAGEAVPPQEWNAAWAACDAAWAACDAARAACDARDAGDATSAAAWAAGDVRAPVRAARAPVRAAQWAARAAQWAASDAAGDAARVASDAAWAARAASWAACDAARAASWAAQAEKLIELLKQAARIINKTTGMPPQIE